MSDKASEITKGPPGHRADLDAKYQGLVDAALEEPGEWFSMQLRGNRPNQYTKIYAEYARRFVDVKSTDARVYVRVKP